jgi:outer membrane lipopolysaccharide assembly protein LptE/RlpB
MIRRFFLALFLTPLALAAGCGYHTLGAATHLPGGVRVLAVPLFATKTESYHTETDAVLRGTILKETASPLTFNATTQQSSSYLITVVASVTLTGADGAVLYQNPNYVFRQQYQATTNLAVFFEESPEAVERLSRDFARQLAADVLESF